MTITNLKGEELIVDKLISFKIDEVEITFTTAFIKNLLFDKNEEIWAKLNPIKQ